MTKEEKQILLQDLCARLPYGVRARFCDGVKEEIDDVWDIDMFSGAINADYIIDDVKPYLRPMSSMTKEEKYIYRHMLGAQLNSEGESIMFVYIEDFPVVIDWLNKNHFDYRKTPDGETMIEAGLALEATEGMYD